MFLRAVSFDHLAGENEHRCWCSQDLATQAKAQSQVTEQQGKLVPRKDINGGVC